MGGAPKVNQPAPVSRDEPKKTNIDPENSSAVAKARRKRLELKSRATRHNLRVDLAGDAQGPTRSGISIKN